MGYSDCMRSSNLPAEVTWLRYQLLKSSSIVTRSAATQVVRIPWQQWLDTAGDHHALRIRELDLLAGKWCKADRGHTTVTQPECNYPPSVPALPMGDLIRLGHDLHMQMSQCKVSWQREFQRYRPCFSCTYQCHGSKPPWSLVQV